MEEKYFVGSEFQWLKLFFWKQDNNKVKKLNGQKEFYNQNINIEEQRNSKEEIVYE